MARSLYAFSVATALLAAACGPALAQDDDTTASILRDCGGTLSGRTLDSCLERARVADQTDPSPDIAALLARLEQQAKAEDGTPSASSPPPRNPPPYAAPDDEEPGYGPPDNGPPDQGPPPYDDDEYGPPPPDNGPGAGPYDQDQPEAAPDDDYPRASPDDGPDDEGQPPPDLPDPPPGDDGY